MVETSASDFGIENEGGEVGWFAKEKPESKHSCPGVDMGFLLWKIIERTGVFI